MLLTRSLEAQRRQMSGWEKKMCLLEMVAEDQIDKKGNILVQRIVDIIVVYFSY